MTATWTNMPQVYGSRTNSYPHLRQIPEAIRERYALLNGDWRWPRGTKVHASGLVDHIEVDTDPAYLRIYCTNFDDSAVDWIGGRHPGDASDKKWWTNYDPPGAFPYEPAFYKVAIFPTPVCANEEDAPNPGLPEAGHTFAIDDNGETYLKVIDDGHLTLNGQALSGYAGFSFNIHRSSVAAEGAGYSWRDRYPQKPNATTYAWGYTGKAVLVTVTDDTEFLIDLSGEETDPIPAAATTAEVVSALEALPMVPDGDVVVTGEPGGPFTLLLHNTVGDPNITATGADVEEIDTVIADIDQGFTPSLADVEEPKEVIFAVGAKWRRVKIDAAAGPLLTIVAQEDKPNVNEYYAVVDEGAFWRRQFYSGAGFPRFGVDLTEREMRRGDNLSWDFSPFWNPWQWYNTISQDYVKSHDPISDNPADYGVPKLTQTIAECESEFCDCDQYIPDGGKEDVDVFDTDLLTLAENWCTDYADRMYSPYLYQTPRGWQLAIENLVGSFIEPKNYGGEEAIPNFTIATWWKFHKAGNTRTSTISAVAGSVATISITMPQITPLAGAHSSLSDNVFFTVINDDGSNGTSWIGTVTATSLTIGADAPGSGEFDPADVDKQVVISFGWTRWYERWVRYLYPRTVLLPGEGEAGEVYPPTEEFPGEYDTEPASTAYCEMSKLGELQDTVAPITDESARYIGDPFDAPTGRIGKEDLKFVGIASRTSDFPTWSLNGGVTDGGLGWLEDDNNLFDIDADPLVLHTWTASAGSNTTRIYAAELYKLWPVIGESDDLHLSNFWTGQGGTRFVGDGAGRGGMIARVAVSGDGTPESPYVWESRKITVQNVATANNPYIEVSPAFSLTSLGRPVEIREPGGSNRGTILNRFKGVPLIITHADNTTETVIITHSAGRQLYWSGSVTVAVGDSYVIDEIEPGSVVHRKPDAAVTHNGWVRPELATQDTRGQNWHLDDSGMLENLPTIVTNYGRLRKRDIIAAHVHAEMYSGLNALRHVLDGHDWDDLDEENYRNVSGQFSSWNTGSVPAVSYGDAGGNFSAGHSYFWGNVGESHYPDLMDPVSINTSNIKVTGGGAPPQADVEFGVAGGAGWPNSGSLVGERGATYHYGKVTNGHTCMASAIDFYAYGTRAANDPDEIDDTLPGGGFARYLFDPMGTGLQFRKWAKWHTLGADVGAERITTDPLGDLNAPPMPSAGPNPDQDGGAWAYANSFYTQQWAVVKRYDVSGGLRYIA